jgi:polygalacturonase
VQDPDEWPLIAPLPSYGRGRERLGPRHISLIHGEGLDDVVITGTNYNVSTFTESFMESSGGIHFLSCEHSFRLLGNNGTIDGQGRMWWELWWNRTLNHTRGHLIELVNSTNILFSNVTLRNSPFWTVHPVYCRSVLHAFSLWEILRRLCYSCTKY